MGRRGMRPGGGAERVPRAAGAERGAGSAQGPCAPAQPACACAVRAPARRGGKPEPDPEPGRLTLSSEGLRGARGDRGALCSPPAARVLLRARRPDTCARSGLGRRGGSRIPGGAGRAMPGGWLRRGALQRRGLLRKGVAAVSPSQSWPLQLGPPRAGGALWARRAVPRDWRCDLRACSPGVGRPQPGGSGRASHPLGEGRGEGVEDTAGVPKCRTPGRFGEKPVSFTGLRHDLQPCSHSTNTHVVRALH